MSTSEGNSREARIAGRFLALVEVSLFLFVLSFVGFLAYGLIHGPNPSESKAGKILAILGTNWKILLIIPLLMFYHPLRKVAHAIKVIEFPWFRLRLVEGTVQARTVRVQQQPATQSPIPTKTQGGQV